jgi:hypothetical protein
MTDKAQLFISLYQSMRRSQHWSAKNVFSNCYHRIRRGICSCPILIRCGSTMLRIGLRFTPMAHQLSLPIKKQESADLPMETTRRHGSSLLLAMPRRMNSFRLAVTHG